MIEWLRGLKPGHVFLWIVVGFAACMAVCVVVAAVLLIVAAY